MEDNQIKKQYNNQFEWSSADDLDDEDKEVLLNDFKKDYAEINGNGNDLE
jgi:hypothetical protein